MPAYGFYIRHAVGIELNNVKQRVEQADLRPEFLLDDVDGVKFAGIDVQQSPGVPPFVAHNATWVKINDFPGARTPVR